MSSSDVEPQDARTARSSGRVRRKPETLFDLSQDAAGEKRTLDQAEDDDDDEEEPDETDTSDDGEPDEEELRESRAKQRKRQASTAKQPPHKRAKTNGQANLAIRTAGNKPRAKGTRISTLNAEAAGGIFAEIFARNADPEEAVAQWLSRFEQHEARALAEIVNLVLRAAGCTSTVTEEHVENPDNITTYITDLQDEFQATDPTDYPLVRKGKTAATVKQGVTNFLDALVMSVAQVGALYDNTVLMENVQAWFCTMSTAANRPFRHTATVVSLITMTALARVARDVANDAAKSQRQAETEGKKSNKNKARVRDIQQRAQEASSRQEAVEAILGDWYDTVFIHRYRDVDPAIRRECAAALGQWIVTLPQVFLDGTHLRYLGWMLSDSHVTVRSEALKQLNRLYKDPEMSGGLKSFTEKFRPRLVEMATSDADTSARTHAIELLDQLRDAGLLNPDDIDAIGRLIFDTDGRVRAATAKFLAEGIKEVRALKIDSLGGEADLLAALPDAVEDEHNSPRIEWLTLKCLAETLQAYHTGEDLPTNVQRSRDSDALVLQPKQTDSRFSLAAEALYDRIPEMRPWRVIAGYLLFDSSAPRKKRASLDTSARFKRDCLLSPKEELTLLDVLQISVGRATLDAAEQRDSNKRKLSKLQREELRDEINETARDLLATLPKLLERFGNSPESASTVLRIQQVLAGDAVLESGQGARAYDTLLEKDKRQFLSHVSNDIPKTAAQAILQAKLHGNDDLATDKIASLYEDTVSRLLQSLDLDTIEQRGTASVHSLSEINDSLLRLAELVKISDPTTFVEDSTVMQTTGKAGELDAPIDCIIALTTRALLRDTRNTNTTTASLEDEIAQRASEIVLFYFRWRFRSIKERVEGPHGSDIPYDELESLAGRRDKYARALSAALGERRSRDAIYSAYAGFCIELQIASLMLENVKRGPNVGDDYTVFIMDLEIDVQKNIMKAFAGAEAVYAALARKKLVHATQQDADDLTRFDDDPVSDSEDDDSPAMSVGRPKSEERLKATLLAEQRLCVLTSKIIFSVLANLMDRRSTKARVERHKNILGANFKAVCDFFDHNKSGSKTARSKAAPAVRARMTNDAGKKSRKSHAIVAESEDEDEIVDDEADQPGAADVEMELEEV